MQSVLQPLPPFITDKFALQILWNLGGKASTTTIRAHLKSKYDLSKFPHAPEYLMTQYKSLLASGYLQLLTTKGHIGEKQYAIAEEARSIIEKMLAQE